MMFRDGMYAPFVSVSCFSVDMLTSRKKEHSMFNMKNTSNVIEFDILLFYIM